MHRKGRGIRLVLAAFFAFSAYWAAFAFSPAFSPLPEESDCVGTYIRGGDFLYIGKGSGSVYFEGAAKTFSYAIEDGIGVTDCGFSFRKIRGGVLIDNPIAYFAKAVEAE